ncbi:MAG: hypothetical protein ACJ71N_05920 [Terriglobales bacterium]|jgi:hypothetical protein
MKKNSSNGNGNNGHHAGEGLNFSSVLKVDVPLGRHGKHRDLVTKILADLERAKADTAVCIPLERLEGEKMQNVRSALNRVTREKNMDVATSTDDKYLYVWRNGSL